MLYLKYCLLFLIASLCCNSMDCHSNKEDEEVHALPIPLNPDENHANVAVVEDEQQQQQQQDISNNIELNTTDKYVSCLPAAELNLHVQLVNDTELLQLLTTDPNITNKHTPAQCLLVLFYSKYCPFSSMAAPHFNALPRAFPTRLRAVAINAMLYHVFNAQNGILGVPTLALFHNGRLMGKFNESEYTFDLFAKFVTKQTGISPENRSYVTSADFFGPVASSPTKDIDYLLGLSWTFISACVAYYLTKSKYWRCVVEMVQNSWRESEAQIQHEHND